MCGKNLSKSIFISCFLAFSASHSLLAQDEKIDLNGVWKTDGYGYLFDIKGSEVSIYETTAISCVEGALSSGDLQVDVDGNHLAVFSVSLPGFIDALMEIHPGDLPNQSLFHRTDTNTYMTAQKIDALPDMCSAPTDTTSGHIQSVFTQTFREHYPFFEPEQKAWVDVKPNTQITLETDLFMSLVDRLKPLKDSHTALIAPSVDEMFFGGEENANEITEEQSNAATQIIEQHYLASPLTWYAYGQIGFAPLKKGAGYLKIDGFYSYSEADTIETNRRVLNKALDAIFGADATLASIIIDLRTNSGGSDFLAVEVARRLTNKPYVAYSKQAVVNSGGETQWTVARPTMVQPWGQSFEGQVVLLTGPNSVSAAETFTMAMMDRKPEVIRVGESTRGAFSDMLPRKLPGGWLFALPNERYIDSAGVSYDKTGITPHIEVSAFSESDILANRDAALDAALEYLHGSD